MKIEIKFGIYLSVVLLSWLTLEYYLGFQTKYIEYHPILSSLIFIPYIMIAMQGMREKKRQMGGGKMTYVKAFRSGMTIGIITAIFSPLMVYIFCNYINLDFFNNFIDYSVKNHGFTQNHAEDYFNMKSYLIQTVIGSLILGLIVSIVASIFISRRH